MTESIVHWINGARVEATSGKHQDVFNPATGEVTGQVQFASVADVNVAVASAKGAFPAWSNLPPLRRARVLFRVLDLLNQRRDELARLITAEHGKVFTDARGEVMRGHEVVEVAPGIPQL